MQAIRTILREILGLFVDDGSFALAILLWIGLVWIGQVCIGQVWIGLPRLHLAIPGGIILFAGLAILLLESATRFARRRR